MIKLKKTLSVALAAKESLLALQYTGVTDYRVILTKWDNIIEATGSSHYWDS